MANNFDNKIDTFRAVLDGLHKTAYFPEDTMMLTPGRHEVPILPENTWCVGDTQEEGRSHIDSSTFEFEPDAGRLQGATDSLHGVFFGRLYNDGGVSEVAIKPFFSSSRSAVREYVSCHFMSDQGFESFEPLGIVMSQEGQAALVTKLEPSIVTLDNITWSPDALEHGDMKYEALQLLGKAAASLAQMHVSGITHGDAQPKNVATSERGITGFIDFETLYYSPEPIVDDAFEARRIADVVHFYSRLRTYHYYPDARSDRFIHFDEQFVDPYEQVCRELDQSYDNDLIKKIRGEIAEIIFTE